MSTNESRATENPAGGNTTSSRHGIDIRQALDILSSRTSHDHSHEHGNEQAACHGSATDEARAMGQTIDLNAPARDPSTLPAASAQSMDEAKQELDEARKARGEEIRAHLQSMSIKDLLQAVMEAQRERVATYRVYDRYVVLICSFHNGMLFLTVLTPFVSTIVVWRRCCRLET
jgi:hypothetical protein